MLKKGSSVESYSCGTEMQVAHKAPNMNVVINSSELVTGTTVH